MSLSFPKSSSEGAKDNSPRRKPWESPGERRSPGTGRKMCAFSSFAPFRGFALFCFRSHGLRRGLLSFALAGSKLSDIGMESCAAVEIGRNLTSCP